MGVIVRVDIAPDLLRWATERAGWDDAEMSRRTPKLAAWLEGTTKPTLKQLEEFARATHTPLGFFFLSEPPEEEIPIPDMRTLGNAAVAQPSADLLDTIYLCQNRQDWYRSYALANGLPELEFVGSTTIDTPTGEVAHEIRERLDFGLATRKTLTSLDDARRHLINRIETLGALVMISGIVGNNPHRRLNVQEFRGFTLADRLAPVIFVNGADTKAAQIFTLVHELAHLWLGDSALSDASITDHDGKREELWCNSVAAEVLVPVATLIDDYQGIATVQELERLANDYRVSTLVVLKRLFDAKLLSWDEFRNRWDAERDRVMALAAQSQRARGGGNFYKTLPLRVSRQFAQAVIASAIEGSTTYRDAYALLGTKKPDTFQNLANELAVA